MKQKQDLRFGLLAWMRQFRVNSAYKSEDYFNEIMIMRETKVLQMIKRRSSMKSNKKIVAVQSRPNHLLMGS